MTDDNLGLRDDELWGDPVDRVQPVVRALMAKGSTLRLAAPGAVDLTTRETLPIVSCFVGSLLDFQQLDPSRRTILTAVDLASGAVHAALTMSNDVRPFDAAMATPPPPDASLPDPAKGAASEVGAVDARDTLGLAWRPGRQLLTLLMGDRVSNRVTVDLRRGSAALEDPEVTRFLEEERARAGAPPVSPWPGRAVPTYEATPHSPAVPAQPGIAIALPRVVVARSGAQCLLHGSFRLALKRDHVVVPAVVPTPYDLLPGGLRPTAVLPVTLLFTGSLDPRPTLAPLRVPTFDRIERDAPPATVTGHFTVDLFAHPAVSRVAQTAFVYAFAGDILAGPFVTARVTEDMLAASPS